MPSTQERLQRLITAWRERAALASGSWGPSGSYGTCADELEEVLVAMVDDEIDVPIDGE